MAKDKKKKLVLLDAHAILHRAYHALPDFATRSGEPTGALYGISTMLMKIIQDLSPDYVVACYDLPGATYRHEAYKEYKSGRKKAEDDLVIQIKRSREIFDAFDIPIYDKPGYEADDILGTIAEITKKNKDLDIIIASGDMDTLQLVDEKKVQVYTLKKGLNDTIIYDEQSVIDRFGFGPQKIADYKGLRGDPSDNIIGVPGIGEKTATELITKFGSVEEIYKTLHKKKESLIDAGIKPRIVEILVANEEEALFSKMLATIKIDVPIDFKLPEKTFTETLDLEKIDKLFLNLEFKSLRERIRQIYGKDLPLISDTKKNIEVSDEEFKETSLALWVLDSTRVNPDVEDILDFAKTDDFAKARKYIFDELKKQGVWEVFSNIESPLMPVIKKMEDNGIKLNTEYLKKISIEYHKNLDVIAKKIWAEAGEEFNINSPKKLSEVLFEKLALKIKGHKKTEGGVKSTRESELEKLRGEHPIIDLVLQYRGIQKVLSTYIDNLPDMVKEDGRLHATFLQTGAVTGRMSSNNPNLQNIPVSDDGEGVRRAFEADTGFDLVAFDYSQIELRIAAVLSCDENLLQIFRSGQDVHAGVASRVFGVSEKEVTSEMRRQAKVINFGILYGMGVNALKSNLGTDRESAQHFYNEYFKQFSGLAEYLEKVKTETYKNGFTKTFFGRRRYFPDIRSRLPFIRAAAERMAINAPIQGTSADIIKIAMIQIDEHIEKSGLKGKVRLLLQVHDELIFEVQKGVVEKIIPDIKKIMEGVVTPEQALGVTFEVNAAVGPNWANLKKIK